MLYKKNCGANSFDGAAKDTIIKVPELKVQPQFLELQHHLVQGDSKKDSPANVALLHFTG